ncbi:hypothetical protein PRIPAC_90062 [Pristionchus pacificus]|uniref:Uncharacterized protein n=1 Tax=Pristionchus pacificus TaxID=54126 RepID=A0A2A6B5Q6_PRIPA|nr:hypothetical protein PRIPAC_90062 [Pristionchus pacificus]|eukprot:PDM61225.1 hypothetical protein PRIPAC_50667 [Pristionchus pacificus]
MLLSRYIECSLTNLPSDIIRKIIEPGNEDFDNMRMISQRWNSLALELFEKRCKLPVIKSIEWNCDSYWSRKLHVYVPRRYVNYFGIQEWKVLENYEDSFTGSNFETETRFSIQMPNFTRLFKRWSRIERLQLKYSRRSKEEKETDVINRTMDDPMRKALGNVLIDEIEFYTCGVYTIVPS